MEICIVDNNSSDASAEIARSSAVVTRLVVNPTNRGLAAANNQGIAATQGEFVLICNPDVVLGAGCVDALVDCARRHRRAAFVVARLHYPDGALQTGVGNLPSLREAYAGRRASRVRGADQGFWWDGWPHDTERQIGHGQEACYLVRREALADIGLQDERYRLDWEGFDWAERAAAAGWEIWFTPAAIAVHVGGVSVRQAPARWVVWSHLGMYRYFANRRAWPTRPFLAAAIALRAVAKLALLVRPDLYQRAHRTEG